MTNNDISWTLRCAKHMAAEDLWCMAVTVAWAAGWKDKDEERSVMSS